MPTYEYACDACGNRFEIVQRFSDDPLTACESCGGQLRKVFHPAGIVFKGSGFYKTDSRSRSTRGAAAPEKKKDGAAASSSGSAGSTSSGSSGSSPAGGGSATGSSPTTPSSPASEKSA